MLSHWKCRQCGIQGKSLSINQDHCGGRYFGFLLLATPTEGRLCCNCVKRVTGTDVGYSWFWACNHCKRRKNNLVAKNYKGAGFETGESKDPLKDPRGLEWLRSSEGESSGHAWLMNKTNLDLSGLNFNDLGAILPRPLEVKTIRKETPKSLIFITDIR